MVSHSREYERRFKAYSLSLNKLYKLNLTIFKEELLPSNWRRLVPSYFYYYKTLISVRILYYNAQYFYCILIFQNASLELLSLKKFEWLGKASFCLIPLWPILNERFTNSLRTDSTISSSSATFIHYRYIIYYDCMTNIMEFSPMIFTYRV